MTDWVDGYIARHFDQVSEIGKVLDPVADRLLFFVGLSAILIDGSIPVVVGTAILAARSLVGGTTVVLAALGAQAHRRDLVRQGGYLRQHGRGARLPR